MIIWEVFRVGDGTQICQCGSEGDAMMRADMHPGRGYRMLRRLADQVIDVLPIVNKKLPGQMGLPEGRDLLEGGEAKVLGVPEGDPFVVGDFL